MTLESDLVLAAKDGDAAQVRTLLAAGADVHVGEEAPLVVAAHEGHTEVVRVLLGAGADAHARDDEALRMAERNGHRETVKVLREAPEVVRNVFFIRKHRKRRC